MSPFISLFNALVVPGMDVFVFYRRHNLSNMMFHGPALAVHADWTKGYAKKLGEES